MQNFSRIILKSLLTLMLVFLIGYLGLIVYITFQKRVIIDDIANKMAVEVNGNVVIEDIELSFFKNFPHVSVLLKDVEIQDRFYARHKHLFLKSDFLFLELDPMKLFKKEFSVSGLKIENAGFYIFTDSSGYTNSYLFKTKPSAENNKTSTPQSELNLERLVLKNVEVIYDDEDTRKLIEVHISKMTVGIDDTDTSLLLSVQSNLLLQKILFTTSNTLLFKNSKAEGDFDLFYDKQMKRIYSDSMELKIGGQPFNLNLRIDLSSAAPKLHLKVNKGSIPLASLKALFETKKKKV